MKKVLLLMICVCATIGAWAMMPPGQPELFGTCGTEKVLKIDVHQTGQLKTALDIAQQEGMDFQYLHIKTGPGEATITLNAEDIAALNSLNVTTIDLQTAKLSDFTLNNSTVSYIMLPLGWTKEQVKVVGETHKGYANFKACLSTSNTKDRGDATLIAYLNVAGSMTDAIRHTYFTKNDNNIEDTKTLGNGQGDCTRLRTLVVMGNFCAKDISRRGVYDSNGHYVINGVADENNNTFNKNTEGGNLYAGADAAGATDGALKGCYELHSVDLRDGYVPDDYSTDIVYGYNGTTVVKNLVELWMPEDPRFKTVPADYLNIGGAQIRQICIPGNIEKIKTRAFAGGGTIIDYVWTTGNNPKTKYDNGAYFVSDDVTTLKYKDNPDPTNTENIDFAAGDDNKFQYGTITLPPNLTLIERFAFRSSEHVSDVYVLNTTAPECHVDAFSSNMYHANNTVTNDKIKEEDGVKIITRDAYNNGPYVWMTILHYPRETTTPNTQRYTDPSREYNIATGERDGNGNMLYFPTQTEFEVAHHQGTHGYLWNAWNIERTWYNNEITLGTNNGWYGGDFSTTNGHDDEGAQAKANQFYINNPNADKVDTSFYDVTLGNTNSVGEEPYPSGLTPYYTLTRPSYNGPLYPQMETTTTTEVIGQIQRVDSDGDPIFEECDNGNYVKDFKYVPAENGEYVQVATVNGYQGTQTPVEGVSTYYSDNQGNNAVTPKVQNGYFFEDGVKNVYTQVDKNNDAIGAKSQYYTKSGDTYTESYLMFNQTYYYPTGNKIVVPKYVACNYTTYDPTKTYYIESNGVYTEVLPNFNGTTYYYENGEYKPTTVAIQDVTEYYQNYGGWTVVMPQITQYYYYADGTEEIDEWISSDHFISGKTWYKLENGTYQPKTLSWYDGIVGDYYYVSGTEANYSSADGQDYNASTTYYTSNTGETVVNPVNFNTTYYYPTYDYSYVDYTGQEGDRYKKKDSYREWTSTDGDAQRYCPVMDDVYRQVKGTQNDYRGWHQFVLAAVAHNSTDEFEPLRSFISDNDWWTICEPYDLKYSDMIKFFGFDRQGFDKKIPYLSKLMYVVRDVENRKITLMFSKNLMEYKEVMATGEGIVHGTIDDQTRWTEEELDRDPVILHKGVPYLIRPNLVADTESGKFTRQFDVYKNDDSDLYQRLKDAKSVSAGKQFQMIYNGEYTVPAYVVGYNSADAASENTVNSKTITNKDGSSFTYNSGTINYNGEEVNYKISDDFTYTFVGTLYKSAMPQYCYFLGWDSKKNCAAFWYSRVLDKNGWNWNNETGIICPNFDTSLEIHQASSMNDPARWVFNPNNKEDNVNDYVKCDDFPTGSGVAGAKQYTMDFGATNYFEINKGIATVVSDMVAPASQTVNVYSPNGVYMGNSVKGLAKGVYVVNGKKYVVK
jgi:hypothetical protein